MPILSKFYGIIIKMYFQQAEHNPPHIHAIYGEFSALISIFDLKILEGDLPSKAISLVLEWMNIHQSELIYMWNTQEFKQLKPLE